MYRELAPSQRSVILIGGPEIDQPEVVFETDALLLEAPNWSVDGKRLLLNGNGLLWSLEVERPEVGITEIAFTGLPPINNDHVLDPNGQHVFLSANDGHIYRGSLEGGAVSQVTPDDGGWHFLHGVSPDGQRLAYVGMTDFTQPGRLMVLDLNAGGPVHLASGDGHLDGPEWSPDGDWLLFNTEHFTEAAGHAQLARVRDGGGAPERLATSDRVDWFPHLSPDGRWGSYISFPSGTLGHPADLDVVVHVVAAVDWELSRQSYPLFGGQGTMNVNSWSPDNARFAFVAYPQS